MKRLLFIVVMLCVALLIGCNDENNSNNNTSNNGSSVVNKPIVEKEEPHMKEFKDSDYSDDTDFLVNKSDDLSYITYDRSLLQNRDVAQLDLDINDGSVGEDRKATLLISKGASYEFSSGEEGTKIINISSHVVFVKVEDDGINKYCWSDDVFSYELSSKCTFNNADLEKIIDGFVSEISGDLF